jgi:hypothetical protein
MSHAPRTLIRDSRLNRRLCSSQAANWLVVATVTFAAFATPQQASAQTAQAATDDGSKELMRRGFAALKKNDLEAARAAFAEAWRKRQHFAIALSLAEVEMRLERHVEAAEHWQYVLGNLPSDLTDQRAHAQAQLAECKTRIGTLTLQVKPPGASVYIDERLVGDAPLNRELYLPPGEHHVYVANAGQRSETRSVRMAPGSKLSLELVVVAGSSGESTPLSPSGSPDGPPSSHQPRPDHSAQSSSGSPLRTPVLLTGAVLTVASAVVGTVFTLKSNAASDDANAAFDEAAANSVPGTEPNAICNLDDPPAGCDLAIERLNDRNGFRNVAISAFVATGVLAAATLTTYLLWPNNSQSASSPRAVLAPAVGPRSAGVAVSGTF